jgi:hypothetical protein
MWTPRSLTDSAQNTAPAFTLAYESTSSAETFGDSDLQVQIPARLGLETDTRARLRVGWISLQ